MPPLPPVLGEGAPVASAQVSPGIACGRREVVAVRSGRGA